MKFNASNFRTIANAEFDVAGKVTLFAGPNAVGKSSTLMALQALFTRKYVPAGVARGDADLLIRDGEKKAVIQIGTDAWRIQINYPDCNPATVGKAPQISDVSAGLVPLPDIDKADLIDLFFTALGLRNDNDRLIKELGLVGVTEHANVVADVINNNGWDVALERGQKKGTELKGDWKRITGEQWGVTKGEGWNPMGFTPDLETIPLAELEAIATGATDAFEDGKRKKAVENYSAEQIDELKRLGAEAKTKIQLVRQELSDLSNERDKTPLPVKTARCPHCTGELWVHEWKVEKLPPNISPEENDRRTRERDRLKTEIEAKTSEYNELSATIEQADNAQVVEGSIDLVTLEGAAKSAQRRFDCARKKRDAAEIHTKIVRNLALQKLLEPEGLRRKMFSEKLPEVNLMLAELCREANWLPVSIDATGNVKFGGRPYPLISESQKYRCRIALQYLYATYVDDPYIVIDGAEILDAPGRNGLFGILSKAKFHTFVGMTISKMTQFPNLNQLGIGNSYWLGAA